MLKVFAQTHVNVRSRSIVICSANIIRQFSHKIWAKFHYNFLGRSSKPGRSEEGSLEIFE